MCSVILTSWTDTETSLMTRSTITSCQSLLPTLLKREDNGSQSRMLELPRDQITDHTPKVLNSMKEFLSKTEEMEMSSQEECGQVMWLLLIGSLLVLNNGGKVSLLISSISFNSVDSGLI